MMVIEWMRGVGGGEAEDDVEVWGGDDDDD